MIPFEPLDHRRAAPNIDSLVFDSWLATAAGQYVLDWEQGWIDRTVPDMFGYHALQIGMPALAGLRECRIPYQHLLLDNPCPPGPIVHQVVGHYEYLPFANQSLDLVVLPHVLEFAQDAHQILREVDRVLIPEGRLVITGLNPLSLWGLKQALWGRWQPVWPPSCQPITWPRLKDWLKLLGFEPELGRFGCYRLPIQREKALLHASFMEKAGDRWWPVFGAVYMISSVKRVRGMRLIAPAWRQPAVSSQTMPQAAQKTRVSRETVNVDKTFPM